MPLFTFTVDISGMERRFSALVDATRPDALKVPLLKAGVHVEHRIQHDVFDAGGPGWKPLAPESQKRKDHALAYAALVSSGNRRSESALAKAVRFQAAAARYAAQAEKKPGTKVAARNLARAASFERSAGEIIMQHRAVLQGGRITRGSLLAMALKEQNRRERHGAALKRARAMPLQEGESRKTVRWERWKPMKGISSADLYKYSTRQTMSRQVVVNPSLERRRVGSAGKLRYQDRQGSKQILGDLRNSIKVKFRGEGQSAAVDIFSPARIAPFHNFGLGHNPQRKFMDLVAEDLDFLAERCKEQMIDAWNEAG